MIKLIVEGSTIMLMTANHLPWHTPLKRGPIRWKLMDAETGEVLDKYTPPRPKTYHPPKWAGSWAASMVRP